MIFFRTLSLRDPPLPILADLVELPWDGGGGEIWEIGVCQRRGNKEERWWSRWRGRGFGVVDVGERWRYLSGLF